MKKTVLTAALAMFVAAALLGCSKRTIVKLEYEPIGINATACPGSIAVYPLENGRMTSIVGNDYSQDSYSTYDSQSDWVTDALLEELNKAGCAAQLSGNPKPDWANFVVTGKIKDIFVKQESLSEFKTTMKVRFEIYQKGHNIFKDTMVVKTRNTTFPVLLADETIQKSLSQGLEELMRIAIPKLVRMMKLADEDPAMERLEAGEEASQ